MFGRILVVRLIQQPFQTTQTYVSNYKNIEDQKQGVLRVYLKYDLNGKPALSGLKRVSKPGLRIYKGYEDLPKVLGSFGIAIISTPKGMMASKKAKDAKIGGELIGYVW